MNKVVNIICDILIVVAAVSLIVGLISRIMVTPFVLGLEASSFLQFSVVLLLFAIVGEIRQLVRK
jgi:hypothetical protein